MTKDDVMNIMKNYNLNEKTELLEKIFNTYKNRGTTYYLKNKEAILNRAKKVYENKKKVLRKKAKYKYRTWKK